MYVYVYTSSSIPMFIILNQESLFSLHISLSTTSRFCKAKSSAFAVGSHGRPWRIARNRIQHAQTCIGWHNQHAHFRPLKQQIAGASFSSWPKVPFASPFFERTRFRRRVSRRTAGTFGVAAPCFRYISRNKRHAMLQCGFLNRRKRSGRWNMRRNNKSNTKHEGRPRNICFVSRLEGALLKCSFKDAVYESRVEVISFLRKKENAIKRKSEACRTNKKCKRMYVAWKTNETDRYRG